MSEFRFPPLTVPKIRASSDAPPRGASNCAPAQMDSGVHPVAPQNGVPQTPRGPTAPGDDKAPPCNILPQHASRTNSRFLFLREIGGPVCLVPFLNSLIAANKLPNPSTHPHWGATLIIDQLVTLNSPIVLPAFFTLAGVGINGGGRLLFPKDMGGESALRVQPGGHIVIRDLPIEGAAIPTNAGGILLDDPTGNTHLERVRVYGFARFGIKGSGAFSIYLDHCQLDNNGTNVLIMGGANNWRIRDSHIRSAAGGWGVRVTEPLNDLLISGCRFESNTPGAIRLGGFVNASNATFGAIVFGNRFESNGGIGVQVDPGVQATRILGNVFSSDKIVPSVTQKPVALGTQIGFNCSLVASDERLAAPLVP